MTTTVIEFAAKAHGYRRGERAEVDAADPRVIDLIEGAYAFEVDVAEADPARPAADPATPDADADQAGPAVPDDPERGVGAPVAEPLTVTADPVAPPPPGRQGRRGTTT